MEKLKREIQLYLASLMIKKILTIILGCVFITAAYTIPPPSGIPIITQRQNAILGKKLMQEIRNQGGMVTDPIINDYIQNLGQKLLSHTASNIKKFHFFIIQDSSINAFAMPGGYIGINSGLIFATRTESELAAVLAHEISHITQHHLERLLEQVDSINMPATVALMTAIALGAGSGSASGANAATGAAMAVMAGSTQHLLNFTRSNEAEADRIGMKVLYASGFDPEAMPNFFAQMEHENLEYSNRVPPFLLTHPVTNLRIAESRNTADAYPKRVIPPSLTYALVKARLVVISSREKFRAVNYFKSLLNTNQEAVHYGYATALYEDRKFALAQTNIDLLLQKNAIIIYQLLKAQILAEHNAPLALNLLQKELQTNAQYYPLIILYAQTLIDNQRAATAKNLLEKYASNYSDDLLFLNLLAQAEAKAHDLGNAYFTKATIYEIEDNKPAALTLLQQALRLPNLSNNLRIKINAKINKLKTAIAERDTFE